MVSRILFGIFCVLLVSCNNSQSKQDTATSPSIPDSLLRKLKLCTEFPVITTDTSKKGIREAGSLKYFLWPKETRVIYVTFLDGDSIIQKKVKTVAKEWENHCGISFAFDQSGKPGITISFQYDGSWSYIGKSSLQVKPSMNFGWLTAKTADEELRRTVLHEFGHALGLIHEHQNPDNNPIKWNKELVYRYYGLSPNYWTKKETDENLFDKYSAEEINGTAFDPQSIMLYTFPKELTIDSFFTQANSILSEKDKKLIGQLYPKK